MLFDDTESLSSGLDNLAEHLEDLEINDDFSLKQKEFEKHGVKRKLTAEEKTELRST